MVKLSNIRTQLLFLAAAGIAFNSNSLAQASEIIVYSDYQYSCGTSKLDDNNVVNGECQDIFKELAANSSHRDPKFIFQSKINNLKYQKTISYDTGIADYLVSTILGIYFPTLETLKPHSGGSFFGGIKLREDIRLDAEIVGIFKGNSLEKNHFDLSTFLSLRFSLPISSKAGSLLLYFSPGVGISELDDRYTNQDDEDTHPTWQLETGVALPIKNSLGGYGGIKYANQLSEEGDSFIGTELGITLKL